MVDVTVSVAVRPWVPTVLSVAVRVYAPWLMVVNVVSAGRTAALSVLVKWTVPA